MAQLRTYIFVVTRVEDFQDCFDRKELICGVFASEELAQMAIYIIRSRLQDSELNYSISKCALNQMFGMFKSRRRRRRAHQL